MAEGSVKTPNRDYAKLANGNLNITTVLDYGAKTTGKLEMLNKEIYSPRKRFGFKQSAESFYKLLKSDKRIPMTLFLNFESINKND